MKVQEFSNREENKPPSHYQKAAKLALGRHDAARARPPNRSSSFLNSKNETAGTQKFGATGSPSSLHFHCFQTHTTGTAHGVAPT